MRFDITLLFITAVKSNCSAKNKINFIWIKSMRVLLNIYPISLINFINSFSSKIGRFSFFALSNFLPALGPATI